MEEMHRNGSNGHNGNGNGNGNGYEGAKPPSSMVKESLAIMFRRRDLIKKVFLWSSLGILIGVFFFGILYESDMEILVRKDIIEPAVTPDSSPRTANVDSDTTTLMINSEVELLQSNDVLSEVVRRCPMLVDSDSFYSPYVRKVTGLIPGYEESKFPAAVSKLGSKLSLTAVKDANNIQVAYTSNDPVKSGCVVSQLADVYLSKRQKINRPPRLYDFFAQQTEDYRKRLLAAEQKLLDYAKEHDAVLASTQANLAVQQSNTFLASLRNTEQMIAQTQEQIRALEEQQKKIPSRIETASKNGDNSNLLSNLKTNLNTLQNQRNDYLFKYDPNYRLVQDVEKQIAQTEAMLAAQEKEPIKESTVDNNPAYMWVDQQLAQSRSTLPSLQAEAGAIARNVSNYRNEAQAFNQKSVTQDDLQREVTAEQGNYLLYLAKREQARIQDMMDQRRVMNVVLDESPTWPALPTFSPMLLIPLSFLLAGFFALGAALIADYLDPSFRTPDEVKDYLDIPVFASIPANGHTVAGNGNGHKVPVGATPRNGH